MPPASRSKHAKQNNLPFVDISKVSEHRSFVLYGRSGSGKTTLAASFPKPLLYLDVKDRGTDSISDVEGIKAMRIEESDDLEMAYEYLLSNNKEKFQTVVIDTLSQLQQLVVTEVAVSKKKDATRATDWGVLTQRDWGDIAAEMKSTIINFRDLPMNVVFIAQDRTFNAGEEENTDGALMPEVGPALSPSIVKVLNASVSMIGNTFIRSREITKVVGGKKKVSEKIEYCLRMGPNPVYTTKVRNVRSAEVPELIVDPSYNDIMEIIKGE